ncbi:MAG: hypothetical protein FJW38_28325 [Acidobacteria bacterium]|nr:hypothetical protein [Acidobacteriota bacterium]
MKTTAYRRGNFGLKRAVQLLARDFLLLFQPSAFLFALLFGQLLRGGCGKEGEEYRSLRTA